jgi:transcriptional regulator with XRE-family HTH domain
MIIGKKLRDLRESKGLLLRQVAAELEVDTAYISKMERGEKNIKREFIQRLASIYDFNTEELTKLWLADKVIDAVLNEPLGKEALKLCVKLS